MIRLIVNADDFGLHGSVNEGIAEAHRKGIVTSTTMLASGAAFSHAVETAKVLPELGVGVHTALVGGLAPVLPASEVPSLVTEEGVFPESYTTFMKRVYMGRVNFNEVYRELEAQFDKVTAHVSGVTHADGHQHMHVLPQIMPIVVALSKRFGLSRVRIPSERAMFLNGRYHPIRIAGKIGLSRVAQTARQTARGTGLDSPRYFWGMNNGGHLDERALLGILKEVSKRTGTHEIMTHPGADDRRLASLFPWGYAWESERDAMCAETIATFVRNRGIRLISYGDL